MKTIFFILLFAGVGCNKHETNVWAKQLVFAFLLVEVFFPWPHFGTYLVDLVATTVKVLVVLVLVSVIDVVNPRLRIDQAMGYYMRVGVSSLAALAFAMIGK